MKTEKKKKKPKRKGTEKRELEFSWGFRKSIGKEGRERLWDVVSRITKKGLWIFGRKIAGKEERNKKRV